jgi:hypothetical protein
MAAVTMSMAAVKPALVGANKSAFKGTRVSAVAPKKVTGGRATLQVRTDAAHDQSARPQARKMRDDRAKQSSRARASGRNRARVAGGIRRSPQRPRAANGSRDFSKTNSIAPIQGPAGEAFRKGYASGSRVVRASRASKRPEERRIALRGNHGARCARSRSSARFATRSNEPQRAHSANARRRVLMLRPSFIHSLPFGSASRGGSRIF